MQDVVRELFEYSRIHHEESEAVVKLALLIMHCDENITNDEVKLLDRIIFITKFDKDIKLAEFVSTARIEILKYVKSQEQLREFIDNCVKSIKTQVIINSLVRMCELIANSDHDYCQQEKEIIEYLSESISNYH